MSFIPLTLLAIGVIPHDIASNKDTGHPSPFFLGSTNIFAIE